MSESPNGLTAGWKIAIVLALLIALANGGLSALSQREQERFTNHEERIDKLENVVRGNEVGTAPREASIEARLEALEKRIQSIETQGEGPESQ